MDHRPITRPRRAPLTVTVGRFAVAAVALVPAWLLFVLGIALSALGKRPSLDETS
jgi:hypothetical protein